VEEVKSMSVSHQLVDVCHTWCSLA
jgi:hypothetical protein